MKMKCGLILTAFVVSMASQTAVAGEDSPVTLVKTVYMPEITGDFDHFTVDLKRKRGHLFVSAEVLRGLPTSNSNEAGTGQPAVACCRRRPSQTILRKIPVSSFSAHPEEAELAPAGPQRLPPASPSVARAK